jgi:hypothetical protein
MIQHTFIQRTTRVQYDFPAKLLGADARQFLRHGGNLIIRHRDQDYTRQHNLSRHLCVRLSRTDNTDRAPRARFAASNNRADFPTQLAQTPPQRASYAPRPDDSQGIFHLVLA